MPPDHAARSTTLDNTSCHAIAEPMCAVTSSAVAEREHGTPQARRRQHHRRTSVQGMAAPVLRLDEVLVQRYYLFNR